jgi:hypothetical protein
MVILWAIALAPACTRDEGREVEQSPIRKVELPTPRPPAAADDAKPKPPKVARAEPTPEAAPPTATSPPREAAAPTSPAPTVPPAVAGRKGVVGRGTDLYAGPSTERVLGTFEGRTDVEVIREEGEFSLVHTSVIGGGSVEGWVRSAAIADRPAPAIPSVAKAGAPAKPKSSAPVTSRPATKAAGDKGPDDILLVPIAGTAKKKKTTPFTHKAHWDEYVPDCTTCHHKVKALGNVDPPKMTCSDSGCHTATECNDQTVPKKNAKCPNFEDAYHMNCITCHKQDGGPTKCAECHTG